MSRTADLEPVVRAGQRLYGGPWVAERYAAVEEFMESHPEAVQDAPVERNAELGYYTNFVNLLDLSAVSVPVGHWGAGPAFGVTVFSDACEDGPVAALGRALAAACE